MAAPSKGSTLVASDLKSILFSKRANIYYLEHCRVLVNGGRVEYVTDAKNKSLYWNIAIANTTSILLGTVTSLTQAAMRELAKADVLVGFCGGGGTPLFSSNEMDVETVCLTPQSEYRPTEYLQGWVRFWFDDELRLQAAKQLQACRLRRLKHQWTSRHLRENGFPVDVEKLNALVAQFQPLFANAPHVTALLTDEARLTKALFKLAVEAVGYVDFTRAKRGTGADLANQYLGHGNYLAYGLGARATWVLGLSHGLAVLHGKTRRGGLVFDAADLIKDSVILPQAFVSAMRGDDEEQFRRHCIESLTLSESLDFIIDTLKSIATQQHRHACAPVVKP